MSGYKITWVIINITLANLERAQDVRNLTSEECDFKKYLLGAIEAAEEEALVGATSQAFMFTSLPSRQHATMLGPGLPSLSTTTAPTVVGWLPLPIGGRR